MAATPWTPTTAKNFNANIWEPGKPLTNPLIEWVMLGVNSGDIPNVWDDVTEGTLYSNTTNALSGLVAYITKNLVDRVDPPDDNTIVTNVVQTDTVAPTNVIWTPGSGGEPNNTAPTVASFNSALGIWRITPPSVSYSNWTAGTLVIYTDRLRLTVTYTKTFAGAYMSITWSYAFV